MQVALSLQPTMPPIAIPTKNLAFPWKTSTSMQAPRYHPTNTSMQAPRYHPTNTSLSVAYQDDTSTVDYSSMTSVFPAEACETIGGEACTVEMYPEATLIPEGRSSKGSSNASELLDREYLEYNSSKTVFLEEACDDLGGEFCEAEYQKGVY